MLMTIVIKRQHRKRAYKPKQDTDNKINEKQDENDRTKCFTTSLPAGQSVLSTDFLLAFMSTDEPDMKTKPGQLAWDLDTTMIFAMGVGGVGIYFYKGPLGDILP